MLILDRVSLPVSRTLKADGRQSVSLQLPRGAVGWLCGPGGSGKTALLETLALRRPAPPTGFRLLGQSVTARLSRSQTATLKRQIGLIEENPVFREDWTVLDNVCLPLRLAAPSQKRALLRGRAVVEQGEAILRWAGLGAHLSASSKDLSYSQKLRLSMARALIGRPELVLVDAPALQIDPSLRELLLGAFAEMRGKTCTLLLATQDEALPAKLPGTVLGLPVATPAPNASAPSAAALAPKPSLTKHSTRQEPRLFNPPPASEANKEHLKEPRFGASPRPERFPER